MKKTTTEDSGQSASSTAVKGRAASTCSLLSDTPRTNRFWQTYSVPNTHNAAEFARELERELGEACELIAEIMKGEVNAEDEAEKFLRAYAPQMLFPANDPAQAAPHPTENDE